MTAAGRVRRAQIALTALSLVAALGWGLAALASVVVSAGLVDLWIGIGRGVRELVPIVGAAAAAGLLAIMAWRFRRVTSPVAVSLWLEERHPELGFALVTALDPHTSRSPSVPEIPFVRTAFTRGLTALWKPALPLAISVALLAALPPGVVRRVTAASPGDALDRRSSTVDDPFEVVVVSVQPPAYTDLPAQTAENPTTMASLAGSRVSVTGSAGTSRVTARFGSEDIAVGSSPGRWTVVFVMPDTAAVLELAAQQHRALVAFDAIADSVPVVRLTSPARDTVMRVAAGSIPLAAESRDDFGLDAVWFELIVSSGEGESFAFRSAVVGRTAVSGDRTTVTGAALSLDSLQLGPGDVVHLRAVARDLNSVTGPGVGVSETRTFRVARAGEYDTTTVVILPPVEPDTSALSQRMLILLAEALEEQRGRLARGTFVRESRVIGRDQARLRARVAEIVFMRLGGEEGEHAHGAETQGGREAELTPPELLAAAEEAAQGALGEVLDFHGDETPVVAINRPLLEAYNAMWDAARELNVGEPGRALPHMYRAVDAIQRARAAERIYLRGRPAAVVVDLARVRLTGNRDAADPGGAPLGQGALTVAERAARVLRLALTGDAAAGDSALIVRTAALSSDPPLAAALAEVAAALRAGRDATDALLGLRRALEDDRTGVGRLAPWGAWW